MASESSSSNSMAIDVSSITELAERLDQFVRDRGDGYSDITIRASYPNGPTYGDIRDAATGLKRLADLLSSQSAVEAVAKAVWEGGTYSDERPPWDELPRICREVGEPDVQDECRVVARAILGALASLNYSKED